MKRFRACSLLALGVLLIGCATTVVQNSESPDLIGQATKERDSSVVAELISRLGNMRGKSFNSNSDVLSVSEPAHVEPLPAYHLEDITGEVVSSDQKGSTAAVTYHLKTAEGKNIVFLEKYQFEKTTALPSEIRFYFIGPDGHFEQAYSEVRSVREAREAGSVKPTVVSYQRYLLSGNSRVFYAESDLETVATLRNPTFGTEVQFTIAFCSNAELPKDDPGLPMLVEEQITGYFLLPGTLPLYFGAVNPLGLGRPDKKYKTVLLASASLYGSDATTFLSAWQLFKTRANFGKDKSPIQKYMKDVSLTMNVAGEEIVLNPEVREEQVVRVQ